MLKKKFINPFPSVHKALEFPGVIFQNLILHSTFELVECLLLELVVPL